MYVVFSLTFQAITVPLFSQVTITLFSQVHVGSYLFSSYVLGLPESILAAAFSRIGQKVLHIDR